MTAVIAEPDQRVGDRQPDRDHGGAGDHGEADVGVRPGVIAVRDQGGGLSSRTPARVRIDRPRSSCRRSRPGRRPRARQVGRGLGVDQPGDGLDARDTGRDEDGGDDEQAGVSLGALGAEQERDRERDRRGGVTEVVDQVGEQRDAAAGEEDRQLGRRGGAEDGEREPDRDQTLAGPFDARVDQAVADRGRRVVVVMAPAVVTVAAIEWP